MVEYKSINKERLNSEHSKLEKRYIDEWRKMGGTNKEILDLLMRRPCEKDDEGAILDWPLGDYFKYPIGAPTERDEIIAETVIQWLGSNVGRAFVEETLKNVD